MTWHLPPLILHPFADTAGAGILVEGSRASLALEGLLPGQRMPMAQLEERLIAGRYSELRMMFYLGKDLERWLSQCADFAGRTPGLRGRLLPPDSFIGLLLSETPEDVRQKLQSWGVDAYSIIFSRALGLHALFEGLPPRDLLSRRFVRYYHQFADLAFQCRQGLFRHARASGEEFAFELYASGEYSTKLEREWSEPGDSGLEARVGVEPTHKGFADLCLTTLATAPDHPHYRTRDEGRKTRWTRLRLRCAETNGSSKCDRCSRPW